MWQPTASIENLKCRSEIIADIRQFFAKRSVMEVDTPCLSSYGVTDRYLSNFTTQFVGPGFADGKTLYLQTSPEYAMKRLLAAGSGCIYQIFKAFRNEEAGRFHNPEFTMLEWYRVGFNQLDLMDEVDDLVQAVTQCEQAERLSYQQAFIKYVGIDPLNTNRTELEDAMKTVGLGDIVRGDVDDDTLMQCLFGEKVEKNIGLARPCFIYHFPASQACLAKLDPQSPQVACRFELYYKGLELANGFDELTDEAMQRERFVADNQARIAQGVEQRELDEHFLAALKAGLPDCAGVALGIDRLLMLALDCKDIREVMAFNIENA